MATSEAMGSLVMADIRAVTRVTPGRGPVLGGGAGRDVDVDVVGVEEVLADAEHGALAAVAQRGLGALLHHLAELARQDEFALAWQQAAPSMR
ncbi:hypothetical protein MASR2M17_23450 [Aminivibrio sp.]